MIQLVLLRCEDAEDKCVIHHNALLEALKEKQRGIDIIGRHEQALSSAVIKRKSDFATIQRVMIFHQYQKLIDRNMVFVVFEIVEHHGLCEQRIRQAS